jgi:hypothetical protein
MRAALYARVSTRDKQDAANQLAQFREFIRPPGLAAGRRILDEAGGATAARVQFQRMFTAAEFSAGLGQAARRRPPEAKGTETDVGPGAPRPKSKWTSSSKRAPGSAQPGCPTRWRLAPPRSTTSENQFQLGQSAIPQS